MKRIVVTVSVMALSLGLYAFAVMVIPWQSLIFKNLEYQIRAQGFPQARVEDGSVSLTAARIGKLHLQGGQDIYNITISYSIFDILQGKSVQGDWKIESPGIVLEGFPSANAQGTFKMDTQAQPEQMLHINGYVEVPDLKGEGDFLFTTPIQSVSKTSLKIHNATMRFAGGEISAKDIDVPLDGKKDIHIFLNSHNLVLQMLLTLALGQPVVAEGLLSGNIPLIIHADGGFMLEAGKLAAQGGGSISLPPSAIPGEGEQITLTRQILENFEYETLTMQVKPEAKGKIALLLALSGHNPKVYEGRAVKLNVRLGGDVLEFLQSNILMLSQPETILRQE